MSHDSRGALLKKGDRVLVEGILQEDPSADGGYCNANVKFVTPEQRDKPPMEPPHNVFNTRMLTKVGLLIAGMLLCAGLVSAQEKDVPWKAIEEIARRGNLVEHVDGFQGQESPIADALQPPPDDSHKWFISIVTTKGCRYCDQLRADFANATALKPWVNVEDYKKSWAHYQVFQIEDESQKWRWKDLKITKFPTLIIQPPLNGAWGDPHTVVMLKEGYNGKPDELAKQMQTAITKYAAKVYPRHQAWEKSHAVAADTSGGFEQSVEADGAITQRGDWSPPVTPPSPLPNVPYQPSPTIPPEPVAPQPSPQPQVSPADAGGLLLSLLMQLLTGLLGGQGMGNLLLVVMVVLMALERIAPRTETKLDDMIVTVLKKVQEEANKPKSPASPA